MRPAIRRGSLALTAALLGLLVSLLAVPSTAVGAGASVSASAGREGDRQKTGLEPGWAPPIGVQFSNPMERYSRNIIDRVIKTVRNTAKGEVIRIVVWNFDDRAATKALLNAAERGVDVRVIVSGGTDNRNWYMLKRGLSLNKKDGSWARKCTGGCRSRTRIMHMKFLLVSRVHKAEKTTMFGSFNLTAAAGERQWNDNVTIRNEKVYDFLLARFAEMAKDKPVKRPYTNTDLGKYRIQIWPARDRNPIKHLFSQVRCKGAKGNTGTPDGRTRIRIAIAGWFDAFGGEIAERVRELWDRGCDVKIITTLAGRGVNQIMKDPSGRGPVPMRRLTVDSNGDGIPEKYLHMKAVAISGVFRKDESASVVFTGSPNWSTRAQHSEEIVFRVVEAAPMVKRYTAHIDRLFSSPQAHARTMSRSQLRANLMAAYPRTRGGGGLPDWLELD